MTAFTPSPLHAAHRHQRRRSALAQPEAHVHAQGHRDRFDDRADIVLGCDRVREQQVGASLRVPLEPRHGVREPVGRERIGARLDDEFWIAAARDRSPHLLHHLIRVNDPLARHVAAALLWRQRGRLWS